MTSFEQEVGGLRLLLGVSSSIASFKALQLISLVRKSGGQVRVVLSANASKLISVAAFEAMSHQRAVDSVWDADDSGSMDHLAATKWANVFAIYPGTANCLGLIANGLAIDALSTYAIAWSKAPLLIAPAMNPEMWKNAAVQENLGRLKQRGYVIVGPDSGRLACDDVGAGRLVEPEAMVDAILAHHRLNPNRSLEGRRVMITAGATREFLDDVRCLTNPSTGLMGVEIARAVLDCGGEVVLVSPHSPTSLPDDLRNRVIHHQITTAQDMLDVVLAEVNSVQLAVFAAAVSDWKPISRLDGKLKKNSSDGNLTVEFERTPDVAMAASELKKQGQIFVGFAAESRDLQAYAENKMNRKKFDLVFANPINESNAGFATETNRGILLQKDQAPLQIPLQSKRAIAQLIVERMAALLPTR